MRRCFFRRRVFVRRRERRHRRVGANRRLLRVEVGRLFERVGEREDAPSENRGPAIISPTGSPFDVKPQGIEIAGMP